MTIAGSNYVRVIAIMGADHSGSSLLGSALGSTPSFPDVFHVGECHAYFNRIRARHGPNCATERPCPIWSGIGREDNQEPYQAIIERTKAPVLVDSSKNPKWFRQQYAVCKKRGWDMKFAICWRDPIGLAHSNWKRSKNDLDGAFLKTLKNCRRLQRSMNFLNAAGAEFLTINGDELVKNPTVVLTKVCEFFDIPYFEGKEEYWNYEHHHLYGSSIQRKHLNDPATATIKYQGLSEDYPLDRFSSLRTDFRRLFEDLDKHSHKYK